MSAVPQWPAGHAASRADARLRFEPMCVADLDGVAALEQDNYEFPWSRGNFADSLVAGHSAWVARIDEAIIGYAVLMRVLDESHLLNITIDHA